MSRKRTVGKGHLRSSVESHTVCAKRPASALEDQEEGEEPAARRVVRFPGSMAGHKADESPTVTVPLTCANGYQVAVGDKEWEGRPLAGRISRISTRGRVCFQVGSHRAPWYILCTVVDKHEYHTLEGMVSERGVELLPHVAGGPEEFVEYYKALSPGYRKHAEVSADDTSWWRPRWVAFRVKVICVWG